jgi:hypothetical protein
MELSMPKYYFKPVTATVRSDWAANTEMEFPVTDDVIEKIRLLVEADNEEDAQSVRMPLTNILAWELDRTED